MIFQKKQTKRASSQIILDTCALIDGRITAIVRAGFVHGNIVIPQFVIAELQYLADNGDSHKRERARFGLDVIRELQDLRHSDVVIAREKFPNIREVDDKLIALAKQTGGLLYTTDYNLNKVAQIEGVIVLNVNELAHALRPNHLPGERLEIKITQTGQEKSQGVGYLDDGTMVVVERAGSRVGQKVSVELSRMLQTQAGKMLFAVLPDAKQQSKQSNAPKAVVQRKAQDPRPERVQREAVQPQRQPQPQPKVQPSQQKQSNTRNRFQKPRRRGGEDALLDAINSQE